MPPILRRFSEEIRLNLVLVYDRKDTETQKHQSCQREANRNCIIPLFPHHLKEKSGQERQASDVNLSCSFLHRCVLPGLPGAAAEAWPRLHRGTRRHFLQHNRDHRAHSHPHRVPGGHPGDGRGRTGQRLDNFRYDKLNKFLNSLMPKWYICTAIKLIVFKKQMLQGTNTDLNF